MPFAMRVQDWLWENCRFKHQTPRLQISAPPLHERRCSTYSLSKPQLLHLKNRCNNNSYLTGLLEKFKLNEIMDAKSSARCLVLWCAVQHTASSQERGFVMLLASGLQIKGTCSVTSAKRRGDAVLRSETTLSRFPSAGWQTRSPPLSPCSLRLKEQRWDEHSIVFHVLTQSPSEHSPSDSTHSISILLTGPKTPIKMSTLTIVWRAKKQMRRENAAFDSIMNFA